MKKGLRRQKPGNGKKNGIQTRDLMKKGLRRKNLTRRFALQHSNKRPDEEGIKTQSTQPLSLSRIIQTRDLMKKGLRQRQVWTTLQLINSNKRPDEEGIKTLLISVSFPAGCIQTRDLMKKGLRRENTNSSKTKRRMGVGALSRTSPFQKKFPGKTMAQSCSTRSLDEIFIHAFILSAPPCTACSDARQAVRRGSSKSADAVFFVPGQRILTCHEPASFLRRRVVDRGLKQSCCSLSVPISRGASIVPANRRTPWLVCYDIADKSRLQRVHRLISRRAIPFQYSVFYINATRNDIVDMVGEIAIRINPHHDDVRAYPLLTTARPFVYGHSRLPDWAIFLDRTWLLFNNSPPLDG